MSYQTARTDLFKLADLHLVTAAKRGRAFVFALADDFDQRLRELADARSVRRAGDAIPTR